MFEICVCRLALCRENYNTAKSKWQVRISKCLVACFDLEYISVSTAVTIVSESNRQGILASTQVLT